MASQDQALISALQQLVAQLGQLTQAPLPNVIDGGFQPQSPAHTLLSQPQNGAPFQTIEIQKPPAYNNAIIVIRVSGGGTVNCQVLSGRTGATELVGDANGTQTSVANSAFQVDGIGNYIAVKVTSLSQGVVQGIDVYWTNATRPGTGTDTFAANQGNANTAANAWPVKVSDGTNVAQLDNSAELRVSQYGTGAGAAGDTAVRVFGANLVDLQAQSITSGTPVSVYAPASGKRFVIGTGSVSVSVACCLLFEDGTGTEVARSPELQPGLPYSLGQLFGNGYRSTTANHHLYLDTSAAAGVVVLVNGTLTLGGDE